MGVKKTIVIDAGNSKLKAAMYFGRAQSSHITISYEEKGSIQSWISGKVIDSGLAISSGRKWQEVKDAFGSLKNLILWDEHTKVDMPIKTAYVNPASLGKDRLASVVGGMSMYPDNDLLILSFGTCMTSDLVIGGVHLGGSISPGLDMRLNAMHRFTGGLPPLAQGNAFASFPGATTEDCMMTGSTIGLASEANHYIHLARGQSANLNVLLTGGDADLLAPLLNWPNFANPFLTLTGLNEILQNRN